MDKGDIVTSGFCQDSYYCSIGDGLNEGYTEYLTKKLCEFNDGAVVYPYNKVIAQVVEMIVGEKMMGMYFTSNIPRLIKNLENYS